MATTTTTKRDSGRRPERVAARIQQELSVVLSQEFGDPRLAGLVIAAVTVTDDLSLARVDFVIMGDTDGAKARAALAVLSKLTSAIRTKLAPRVGLRRVPQVSFYIDEGREESQRLDALLHEVGQELKKA